MQKFLKLNLYLWLGIACVVLAPGAMLVQGQTPKPAPTPSKGGRAGGRDPFYNPSLKPKPVAVPKPVTTPKVAVTPVKPPPAVIVPLDLKTRISLYRAQKQEALLRQEAPPKPTTALLIQELEVAGIFRTPRGYAAMVHAEPIKLSYIIYPGESVFDGQLVAIDEDYLVFRRRLKWSDGREEMRVERKALRPPVVIADPLAAEKATPQAGPPAAAPQAGPPATSTPAPPAATDPSGNTTAPVAPAPVTEPELLENSLPAKRKGNETSQPAPEFSEKPAATTPATEKPAPPKKSNPRTKSKTNAKVTDKPSPEKR